MLAYLLSEGQKQVNLQARTSWQSEIEGEVVMTGDIDEMISNNLPDKVITENNILKYLERAS